VSVRVPVCLRRLLSNTHALYQYCPIPRIMFPELETELFCNIYYLRHLCDTARFPDWPIKDPVCVCVCVHACMYVCACILET
jgi:hypothetical protein